VKKSELKTDRHNRPIQKSKLETKKQDWSMKESELKMDRYYRSMQKSELDINRLYPPIQSEDRICIGRSINRSFRPSLVVGQLRRWLAGGSGVVSSGRVFGSTQCLRKLLKKNSGESKNWPGKMSGEPNTSRAGVEPSSPLAAARRPRRTHGQPSSSRRSRRGGSPSDGSGSVLPSH
jgi:hypothetical protein